MKKIFILIFCLSISSCGLILLNVAKSKTTNVGPLDSEGMLDIDSPYNADNLIYQTNRSFIYDVDQVQKNRNLRFQLELLVIPGALNSQESKVKYKYTYDTTDLTQQELRDWRLENGNFHPEFTSLTEKIGNISLHPPRSKTLEILERAPFPEIPSRFGLGETRWGLLIIPRGNWGEMAGSKIKWKYITDSVVYRQDTIPYFCRVQAEARSKKGGYNTLEMHFNVDSGFTKLNYQFEDKTSVKFVLKEIR